MPCLFAAAKIEGVRVWASPEGTRVVFDLSQEAEYKIFTLDNPDRIVIDMSEATLKAALSSLPLDKTGILKIRHAQNTSGKLRVVFDMQSRTNYTSFMLPPNQSYRHRLVIDLESKSKKPVTSASQSKTVLQRSLVTKELSTASTRSFIIAIDPGHGGEDTGAIGHRHHLREKDVVLSVAKKLEGLINAQSGMKAFLIRSGDYYVGLRRRMILARERGADLFISVHADSFDDTRATGASVYVLSEKGASNEAARWLAERENRADLIGGISLEDKSSTLASVLLDLSQTASRSASQELASHLIYDLSKVTDLHHKSVQRAGFMVLKSPDIPSVLVELGFISNQKGEEKLLNKAYQEILARALLSGIKNYAAKRPLPLKSPFKHENTLAEKEL